MIGRGGMGVVARAVDELLNREVAVKILRAFTDSSASDLAGLRVRMQREAQAAARIRHSGDHVRVAGANTSGWMPNDNLTKRSGASTRC
ncbi:hypothetical protein ACFRU3_25520 [Streptomyces sp. NPDC056910]|uniref:hypothetical protein n=1 Tax=Streptomyces sp. NPDC056910 TaxID=3345964 RepID=UPI00368D40C7